MGVFARLFGRTANVKPKENPDVCGMRELPIVSSDCVPKSRHPNGPPNGSPGRKFADPAELASFLTSHVPARNLPLRSQSDHLVANYRAAGCSTTLKVYRIAASTWQVSMDSDYID